MTVIARKPRVVCLGTPAFIGDEYLDAFKKDFDYSVLDASNHAEMHERLPAHEAAHGPVDAFIIRMGTQPYEPFDAALFAKMPQCRLVVSASAGYNEFPVAHLAGRGVYFCNTVAAVAEATADMALFLILAVLRNTKAAEKSAAAGTWRSIPGARGPARDPAGLTLGLVGLGAIGQAVARKAAAALNMKVRYYSRQRQPAAVEARCGGAEYCGSLHALLAAADVVSLHCPLTAQTEGLIGAAEFAAMKDGAFFINTARGAVVDEAALKAALQAGKVARAGLDVFCNEPTPDPWFLHQDNVVVQPHLGGLTDVAFYKAERECFENIRAFFATGTPNSPVLPLESK